MTSTQKCAQRYDFSIYLASIVDHFDSALYGFLAPILAPLFFPDHDPATQLILAYSVLGTSLLTRPLGSVIFGSLAHKIGPAKTIQWSLIGLVTSLLLLCLLPTHAAVGPWAPALLILLRMIKGVFAAGEGAIAKLFILENKNPEKAFKVSYQYQHAIMMGIIAASGISSVIIHYQEAFPSVWRLAFGAGFLGSLLALRYRVTYPPQESPPASYPPRFTGGHVLHMIRLHKKPFFTIMMMNALSYVTYSFPFILMNPLIPMMTHVTLEQMMALTIPLLILDFLLIPALGEIVRRFPYMQTMILAAAMLAIGTPLLFYFMPPESTIYIALTRMWIIFWGVAFMCPLNLCTQRLLDGSEKYLISGIASSLGASTFGRLCPTIGLYIWQTTQVSWGPALYISLIAGITIISLLYCRPLEKNLIKTKHTLLDH